MAVFGLIGYPLSHSWSASYFKQKFETPGTPEHQYRLFPLQAIDEITMLLEEVSGIRGLNVTSPYKISVLPFLDELSNEAESIGAVNCIKVSENNGIHWLAGYNTDAYGFETSLKPLLQPHHTSALVLGTGGASKAVGFVLEKLGIKHTLVSRGTSVPGTILYEQINGECISEHTLIINTSPAGMFPDIASKPVIPYDSLTPDHLIYDLVYNPEQTAFLKMGLSAGCVIKNGLEMLHLQAERSWEIWMDTNR